MKLWMLPILASWVVSVPIAVEASNQFSSTRSNSAAIAQANPSTQQNPTDKAWELIRTARRYAANGQSVPATQALAQAEQTAALLSNSAAIDQLFAIIAAEQAKLGEYNRAIAITTRMSYTTMPPQACCVPVRTEAETAIVQAYLQAGQVSQARQFAERIQSAPSRNQVLIPIVAHLANQGQFTDAIALSKRTADQADRARYSIIKGYINANRLSEAFVFTKTIVDKSEQLSLLTTLAPWAARSGQIDLSYQIANQIQDPGGKATALSEVAFAYASAGQRERAVSILSQAYQLAKRQPEPPSFSLWAEHFARVGAFDRALAIANSPTGYERADAKVRIARIYSNTGQYARAIALAQQVRDGELRPFGDMPDLKVEALQQMIRQAAKAGQYDLAMRAVNVLEDGPDRVKALRAIAQQYRVTKQPQKAAAVLNQAVEATRTVNKITIFLDRNTSFTVSNAGLLVGIAQDYLALNQSDRGVAVLDQALGSARGWKEADQGAVSEQIRYLSQIARLYSQLGRRDRAVATAETAFNSIPVSERSSVFPAWTVQPLAEVAQIFYTAGADKQATEMLAGLRTVNGSLSDPLQQLWGMVAITKAYAAMGAEAQVKEMVAATLKLAQSLEPAQRGWVEDRLAIAAASSDPAYALQLIQRKPDRAGQIPTLAQMAVNYYAAGQDPQAQAVVVSLQQIATLIADDGQREQALNDAVRNYFVPQGARNLPIGQLLQAGQINADIQSANFKAYNWFLIAQAYAFQGEVGRASQTMGFALDAAKTLSDRFERRDLFWQLFEEALRNGERSLAAQIATGFDAASDRAVALQRVKGFLSI